MTNPVEMAVAQVHRLANARATGCWRFEDGRLLLESFVACDGMSPEIARGFPVATADVPVTDTGLGIVLAARDKAVTEYRAVDLPAEAGSGFWLRGFEADRSVAVPQLGADGRLIRILSVAVQGLDRPKADYAELIFAAYERYLPLVESGNG